MATTVIKAIKGNRAYTINSEQEKKIYKAQGFDIYENGKLVEQGAGKSVSLEEFNKLKAENETLKKKNSELKKELKDSGGNANTEPPKD